jgi:hypothetical protein
LHYHIWCAVSAWAFDEKEYHQTLGHFRLFDNDDAYLKRDGLSERELSDGLTVRIMTASASHNDHSEGSI